LPLFEAHPVTDRDVIGRLTRLPEVVIEARLGSDHELYGAFVDGEPAGYGWLARRSGGIDELDFGFEVPPGNGYLWDFVTLPQARGRGVYPHLLQAIVAQAADVERFWIGYEERNLASARGIEKAGFRLVGDLEVTGGRVSGFAVSEPGARAEAAGALLHPKPLP
jgi:GNAT superfamily N-acetyltransferase